MRDGIAGSLLLDREVIDDPYPFYGQLRAQAPVWEVPGTGVFTVSTFDLVAEVTSRVEDFSSNIECLLYRDDDGLPRRLPFGDAGVQALATADPPTHALHRGTVFPQLVAKRMAELEPDVVDITNGCMTRALEGETVEFMSAIGNVVPITIVSRLIGFHDSDLNQLLSAAFDSTAMLGSTLTLDELMELIDRIGEIQTWIADQLSQAIKGPSDDLLGAVARGVDAGVFSDFEAHTILHTLLSAGGESTTSLLGNAVRILAEDQELQQHLRQDSEQIRRSWKRRCAWSRRSATTCVRCPTTRPSAVSTSRPTPQSCCSGPPPTVTLSSSNDPTKSISTGRRRATICRSVEASTTALAPP